MAFKRMTNGCVDVHDIFSFVMLFAGWEVRTVKNCDRGLENAASSPRSPFFTIRTDPKPVNNLFIIFQALKRKKKTHGKNSRYCDRSQNPDRAKNQSDCRIRYRARLEKKNFHFPWLVSP